MRTLVKKPSNFEKLQKEVNQSQPSVAFHIETSLDLQYKSNAWFLYEMQHWIAIS